MQQAIMQSRGGLGLAHQQPVPSCSSTTPLATSRRGGTAAPGRRTRTLVRAREDVKARVQAPSREVLEVVEPVVAQEEEEEEDSALAEK